MQNVIADEPLSFRNFVKINKIEENIIEEKKR